MNFWMNILKSLVMMNNLCESYQKHRADHHDGCRVRLRSKNHFWAESVCTTKGTETCCVHDLCADAGQPSANSNSVTSFQRMNSPQKLLAPVYAWYIVFACVRRGLVSLSVFNEAFGVRILEVAAVWIRAARLRQLELQPDVMAYSAAISACEEGFRWMRAIRSLSIQVLLFLA